MPNYAYLRVSTEKQTIESQKMAVKKWAESRGLPLPDENIFYDEAVSGAINPFDRPGFKQLWEKLHEGDILIVPELSRLGRSLRDIITIVDELNKRSVQLIAVKEGLDPTQNQTFYKVALAIFGVLAEVERDLIRERTKEGLARARAQGKKLGRPRTVDYDKVITLLQRGMSPKEIADILEVPRTTIYTVLKRLRARGIIQKREYYIVNKGGDSA